MQTVSVAWEPPPAEVWIDDRIVVEASGIEGSGLLTTADIPSGTVVLRLAGRLVSTAELVELIAAADADPRAPYVDTITVHEDGHLAMPPGTPAHFANHSCDPNLWHVGPYELATRRDVRPGEELMVDYGTFSGADGLDMACTCGSALCRGQVTSDDWQRPELQARYRGHWTPALQQRIDGLRARP